MKLLLIEVALRQTLVLVSTLRQNSYVVEVAGSFAQAYEKIKFYRYD